MDYSERQKEERKIRNKRTGRTRKIVGVLLVVFGIINISDMMYMFSYSFTYGLSQSILPVIAIIAGVWLLRDTKRNVEKWDRYEALIDQEGNTSIDMLSRSTGIPADKVRRDLQEMINNGFFRDETGNIGAYINGEYDILVMMRNGKPKVPIEDEMRKKEKEAAKAAQAAAAAKNADPYADAIAEAAEEVKDPDVVQSLRSIEASVRKINRKTKRSPEIEDNASVRQLKEIYLPKTMELVEKLRSGDAGPEAMLEIKGILNTCATAFENIVDKVYKSDDEDTLVDIEVLRKTFEREGLLDSDFDFE